MKADRVGNSGKTAVYIVLSLLIHATVIFGIGAGHREDGGSARPGPLRIRSLSNFEADEPRNTPAPEAAPPQAASPRPSPSDTGASPPTDEPPSPDPSPGSAPSETANRIEQALSGWDPSAGAGLGENGRTGRDDSGTRRAREVSFAELGGDGLELPVYPELARKWGWEGIAVVRIRIGPAGNVREVELISTSGYDLLDRAALETVEESWKFSPPGREVETVKEFEFLLKPGGN